MDLLQEAKKSNKNAFNELVEIYNHIFYKTARIYFNNDKDIYKVIKSALSITFSDIVNAKDERDFLCLAIQILLEECEKFKKKFSKDFKRKIDSQILTVNIGDNITSAETNLDNVEYQAYRKASVVEEYITSINEEFRVIAILYYYADLTPKEISKILKVSQSEVIQKIDDMRIKIYEIIKNKEVDIYYE
jgi:RNA polymerase sigma factor (sigma-70 family)